MVKNSPSKAGDTGLIPGHIPHATACGLHTTTREGRAPQQRPSTVKNKSLLKKKKIGGRSQQGPDHKYLSLPC